MSDYITNDDGSYSFTGGMDVDGDGSPRCYGPNNSGLDYNANGGPADNPYGYELNPATGKPFVQGVDAPAYSSDTVGFYVSSTTYQNRAYKTNDPKRYLNSEEVIFGVVPGPFRKHVPGIVVGCRMTFTYNGKTVEGLAGDVGPAFGEASIAAAKALGLPASPRNGGVSKGVVYTIYPGVVAPGFELQPA